MRFAIDILLSVFDNIRIILGSVFDNILVLYPELSARKHALFHIPVMHFRNGPKSDQVCPFFWKIDLPEIFFYFFYLDSLLFINK